MLFSGVILIQADRPRVGRRSRKHRPRHATRIAPDILPPPPPPPAVGGTASISSSTIDLASVHDDAPLFV